MTSPSTTRPERRPNDGQAPAADPEAATSAIAPGRPIGREVSALVKNVASLALRAGDEDAGRRLMADIGGSQSGATVVLVGEAKQGKSSLVNALVGAEGLSPVDADVATAAPLRLTHGPELQATLQLDVGDRLRIEPTELPGWVSMAHAPLAQLRQVVGVDVEVPSPLLQGGVTLIDTPGVGGLVEGHAAITLRALERAQAMLFVTDADTKLTRPELEFLVRASQRIAAVVFVITKVDATPAWEDVVAENREALHRWAPRFGDAPMVPVSSRLAWRSKEAARRGDKVSAANLWSESGIGQLQTWISRRILPASGAMSLANSATLARSTLERMRAQIDLEIRSGSSDPAVMAAIEAEQKRVDQLREHQASWGSALERALFEARNDLKGRIRSSSEDLQQAAAERIETSGRHDADTVVARLDADLDAQAAEVADAVEHACRSICERILTDLQIESPMSLASSETGTWHVKPFGGTVGGSTSMNALTAGMAAMTGLGMVTRVSSMVGQAVAGTALGGYVASGASALPASLGWVGALGPIAVPVIGAAGVALFIQRVRGGHQRRQELGAWTRGEIARASAERQAEVDRVLTAAKLDITDVVRAGLAERTREVTAAVDAARAAKARSEQERSRRRAELTKLVAAVEALTTEADGLIAATLSAARLTAPNAGGSQRRPG